MPKDWIVVGDYIERLRNPAKRAYAKAYLRAKLYSEAAPERPQTLSCMAAQAVRMNFDALYARHK